MALRYTDLLDILLQRAERLGLMEAEQLHADAAELELYLFQALLDITESVDIPTYMVNNTTIATTVAAQASYPLPADYGRLIQPRVQNRRGIYLYDTVRLIDLEYIDPNAYARQYQLIPGTPRQFTVTQRTLSLFPQPDSNNTNNYTVRGIYIQRVDRPELEDEVLLSYPTALIDEALFRLASDMRKPMQALAMARSEAMARLLAGSK